MSSKAKQTRADSLIERPQSKLFTRTFRVGLRTCIEDLRRCASDYWGLQDGSTVLYIIEEDGTLRDLQYELASCVTKIVE